MKWILILPALLGIVVTACNDDKGNYVYHAINEITFAGIAPSYNAMQAVDILEIDPVVEMTDGDYRDTSRFKYTWLAVVSYQTKDTIGKERKLSYQVKLDPGTYQLCLKVWDKQTDVTWKYISSLTVGNMYAKGILLVGENDQGDVEMQMVSMVSDTLISPNILEDCGLPPLQGPLNVLHTGYVGVDNRAKLWIMTRSGSYFFDRITHKATPANTFKSLVFSTDALPEGLTPVDIAPRIKDKAGNNGGNGYRAVVCSNGYIFNSVLMLVGGDYYTNPVNRTAGDMTTLLKAKPFLMYALNSWNGFVWYDADNERFMRVGSFDATSLPLEDQGDNTFPWNQQGDNRTLVYAENTRNTDGGSVNGNTFALMKDNANQFFIYKFYVGTNVEKRFLYTVSSIATDFDKAKFYAFSSNRTLLFYVVDRELYVYDYNQGNEKCSKLPGFGVDEITMLKFDTQMDPVANPLYIATYNASTRGTLQRYDVGTNPDQLEISPNTKSRWSGLTKIANMSWRAIR
ncbi:MAG: hypothetical protein LBP56_05530 [Odoribacteraceae bacterium]|nr:hypothetical protein [Odoribacteraceae bacterium]